MKKTILSIAVLFASVAGFSASAQTPNTTTCPKAKTECTKGCAKKDAPRYNPFAGLNLTDKQKAELQALKPGKDAKCKDAGKECKSKKECKAKDLSKAEKQAFRKQAIEKRQQGRRDYLAKVKNILTPEQYVQFLENNYVDAGMKGAPGHGKMAQGKHHGKKAHAFRGDRKHKADSRKGRRMNGQQQNAAVDSTFYIDNGLIKVFPYQAQR